MAAMWMKNIELDGEMWEWSINAGTFQLAQMPVCIVNSLQFPEWFRYNFWDYVWSQIGKDLLKPDMNQLTKGWNPHQLWTGQISMYSLLILMWGHVYGFPFSIALQHYWIWQGICSSYNSRIQTRWILLHWCPAIPGINLLEKLLATICFSPILRHQVF